ncbi:hypothetical protein JNN96_32720 [Mycobacterium sp. DSM 3803]|nr:hypothetical protein [Mycobacterium sp. DSM 3803]
MAAPRPTYVVGIRSIENPNTIEERSAVTAAVRDSGVLHATFGDGTEHHYSPAWWAYLKRSES